MSDLVQSSLAVWGSDTMEGQKTGARCDADRDFKKTLWVRAKEVASIAFVHLHLYWMNGLDFVLFYCIVPMTRFWWAVGIALVWLYFDRSTPSKGGRRMWVLRLLLPVFRRVQSYYPVKVVGRDWRLPLENHILDIHPHGVTMGAAAAALYGGGMHAAFPGFDFKVVVWDPICFTLPVAREIAMGIGFVSKRECSIRHVLQTPERGKTVVLFSGDYREVINLRTDVFYIGLQRRGFCRVALLEGAPLIPAIMFGENLAYRQPIIRLTDWIYRKTGWRFSLTLGRGFFQKRWGILPLRVPHTLVVGSPVEVQKTVEPTRTQVEALHGRYVKAVRALYKEYSPKYSTVHLPLFIAT
ncbi:hypothetical protein ONE63_011139 [Megalurothrips usitatus]|uniref:Acyltransferase n=1 Tax=Megalurothrips usitatus TaxID=439358 RepID=A0AAV7XF51_9NEOP|nr:hypothetical protein ONE63_011139 [Megalurothrips usitatus]